MWLLEAEKLKGHPENMQCAKVKGAISVNPHKLVCYDTFFFSLFYHFLFERENGHNQYTIIVYPVHGYFFLQKSWIS
jgi:hypothetical protein